MGHVWLARDEKSGLDVALKIVAREGKSGHRAEREARAAASLRHPRCQRILSLARDTSHVYIAYEYIPGRTLREAMRAGELDDRGAIEAAAQIAEALAHAHGRGIVHRDVKPANVLLAESPGIDVRLLDFGLAQMAEFDTLTALGDIPGTLAYISPERLQGLTATTAADVWGLGVLLWEALAGEHPFWGGDMVETSRRIQRGAPTLESLRPDLPAHLLATVASALLTSPQRRPRAERLAEELRSLPKRRLPQAGRLQRLRPAVPVRAKAVAGERLLPAALAGIASGWVATRLPFYPAHWPLGARRSRRGARLRRPTRRARLHARGGVLPAGQHLARARARLCGARGRLARADLAGRPRGLAARRRPAARAARRARLPARWPPSSRGAAPAAPRPPQPRSCSPRWSRGYATRRLPFDGSLPPLGLGVAGSNRPSAVAGALWAQLAAHPDLLAEAVVLAAAAVAAPVRPPARPLARGGIRRRLSRRDRAGRAGSGRAAARRRRLADRRRAGPRTASLDWPQPGTIPAPMSVLRNIESKLESLFEGVFGRAFRTNVQPVELARKLIKEMDDHRNVSVSRVYVPNEYTVFLSPGDREQFSSYELQLTDELAEYLAEHARRENYVLLDAAARGARHRRRPRRRRLRHRHADGADGEGESRRAVAARRRQARRWSTSRRAGPQATEAASPVELGIEREIVVLTWDGQRHEIGKRRVVLGRSKDADLQLADPNASRRHAELRQEGATYWLIDLDSTNGVEVKGKRVKRVKLEDGTRFTIGSTEITFTRETP